MTPSSAAAWSSVAPHPSDRRKVLIQLTPDGQQIVDQQLPVIHAAINRAIGTLTEPDRAHLLRSLTTIRAQVNQIAGQPLPPAKPRRKRPARKPRKVPDA